MSQFQELTDFLDKSDCVEVEGYLSLYYKSLISLPESFGNLKIDCSLDLSHNPLISLPESFGNLKIDCSLDLSHNPLTSLPESFGNLILRANFARTPSSMSHNLKV